jgi:putative intracellular protease/amidase
MVRSLFILFFLGFSSLAIAKMQVVVVLSEETKLNLKEGKSFSTGHYLNEFAIPLMAMIDNGLRPVFFTPSGKNPNLDQDSIDIKYFKNDKEYLKKAMDLFSSIGKTSKLNSLSEIHKLDLSRVSAVFIPGGHAPMIDLLVNKDLGKFLIQAQAKKITTALICHGPIAILSAMENPQEFINLIKMGKIAEAKKLSSQWIYKDYEMTIFSNEEEVVAESGKLKGQMFFYPQDALSTAGGKYKGVKAWSSNVVVDRELITAQNPNSVDEFSQKLVALIKSK